jgi:hypothetical protein
MPATARPRNTSRDATLFCLRLAAEAAFEIITDRLKSFEYMVVSDRILPEEGEN